jgi:hypothetical protein
LAPISISRTCKVRNNRRRMQQGECEPPHELLHAGLPIVPCFFLVGTTGLLAHLGAESES